MKIYLVMGTHLAEIRQCIRILAGLSGESPKVEVHLPDGLDWGNSDDEGYSIQLYEPETVLWVFDPDAEDTAFIVLDPRQPLIEQLEQLADNLAKCFVEPVKILTCVDCRQTEENARLRAWFDACIYYSDIVLLGNRQDASKAFMRDYQKHYERLCYPSLFLFLKGAGNPGDPVEVLTPGTRRLSQLFDLEGDGPQEAPPGVVIESSCDLELEEAEADPFRQPGPEGAPAHVPDVSDCIVPA
ncbi:MAG: hypothetical protein AB3N33_04315 [Puniceicoccaceae bacterium]